MRQQSYRCSSEHRIVLHIDEGMTPNISARDYIRWLPEKASEPTTTFSITSAEARFVDIRIYRPSHGNSFLETTEGT